ncbi:uncharacterized protein LOC113745785 [Larimichthys crocea]|uniref:uncharacterized protein LOC113745785 n=1 Tax=Larimichthys crocea TaxID=215358 RepID=UPI000F5E55AC|nr:uncharacterized protein LOC113745785 [Larimichthys crocea]
MSEPQQVQPVTALAQMVAEVAAMSWDQAVASRQQLAALQLQTSPGPSLSGMTLQRMTGNDDAQSYIEMFEATASACGWPEAERPAPAPGPPAPHTRPSPAPRSNIPSLSLPPQGPAAMGAALSPQRVPQAAGQECWRCGQPGHFRRECPLMEVGQVIRVVGPPAPSPGPGETYSIPTDASGRGLGAVLSQQVRGVDRPVLYISRKLSEREARYSTVERECLAIRWAVGALRYYLLGRPFTLCSDHAPLQWLHRMKDANARITRWYLALQPFKFTVVHRPGAQMAVADFLSHSLGGGG